MRFPISALVRIIDIVAVPFVYPSAFLLKTVRAIGVERVPRCKRALMQVGVFPIRNHYYEPRFDYRNQNEMSLYERRLPGIDWNVSAQRELLSKMTFSQELEHLPLQRPQVSHPGNPDFYMNNGAFESGDAEYWYQLIRLIKPKRIFEIGSGNSTLVAMKAVQKNKLSDPGYVCQHVCIEPYEMPWLENTGVTVIRKKIEDVELSFFSDLGENDILFIDSSHIIRPYGDVLFEYLELLPTLKKGVIVHIHDIFSPKEYRADWIKDEVRFWNEQYLLEAFLTENKTWSIIGAINYLSHRHHDELKAVAPFLTPDREPGSFYIQKML